MALSQEQRVARLEKARAWRQANPEKYAAQVARAKARLKQRYETDAEFRRRTLERNKRHYANNPHVRAKHRQLTRANELKRAGFTPALFDAVMAVQGGCCAVCGKPFAETPSADHNHETGAARGLLHRDCNTIEGLIKRTGLSPQEFGKRLAEYLANPPADAAKLV